MLCRNPFVRCRTGEVFASPNPKHWIDGIPFRCGKCLACRVATRREWTSRLIFEMLKADAGCFITLTYSEDYVPVTETGYRTLSKRDLQLFMKRLRVNLERAKKRKCPIRFYACGEYGSHGTQRPHYHIILFGVSDMDLDLIRAVKDAWSEPAGYNQKGDTPLFGSFKIDPLTSKTVAYTAGYVMKKLVNPRKRYKVITSSCEVGSRRVTFDKVVPDRKAMERDDNGVQKEFRTMSRMPGLGSGFIFDLLALFKSNAAFRRYLLSSDIGTTGFRAFGRMLFFDRFMRTKLREALGIEYDPTGFYAEFRDGWYEWARNPNVHHDEQNDYYHYIVAQDDQRFKQLQDRIKRQLQKREKF